MRIPALLLLTLFAGALCAQYSTATSSAPYIERTGTSSVLGFQNGPNFDDNYLTVTLPFDFTYFDRTYRHCYMNTNGRITFMAENASTFSTGTLAPTAAASLRETIHVISADLIGGEFAYQSNFGVFFEAGRVVFQWRDVSFFAGSRHLQCNLQCHLLPTGEIEFYFGANNSVSGFVESGISYASGLVNIDGTTSVAGFGGVTALQSTLPAANAKVTFTPSFVAASGVRIQPGTSINGASGVTGAVNLPVLTFRLAPFGAGATVTQLQMAHSNFAGSTVAVKLVRDTAPLGLFNGETILATSTQVAGISTFAISEAITASAQDYLVLFDLTSVSANFVATPVLTNAGALPASVSGGALGKSYDIASGAVVSGYPDSEDDTGACHYAGATDRRLGGFTFRRDGRLSATDLTQVSISLAFGALPTSAISNVRLWRDGGALGVQDGSDVALTAGGAAAATVTFTGFSEACTSDGRQYYVTADVNPALAGFGTITMTLNGPGCAFSTSGVLLNVNPGAQGFTVLGTAASVFARVNKEAALSYLPQQGGDSDVPALAFTLQANLGTPTVSSLTFRELSVSMAGIFAARLYLDTGTTPGRFDSGDALATGTVVVGASTIVASAITNITLGAAPFPLLLVIDFGIGAASISRTITLASADIVVSAGTVQASATLAGPAISVGAGSALAGVDVSVSVNAGNLKFGGYQYTEIAAMSCSARGIGGNAPTPRFTFVTAAGDIGNFTGLAIELWREGAGPLGVWDASDRLIYLQQAAGDTTTLFDGSINGTVLTGTTVNYLYLLRRFSSQGTVKGDGRIVFRGLQDGTNVHMLPVGTYPGGQATNLNVLPAPIITDGGVDGGCTASESRAPGAVLLAGLVAAMLAGLRTRRRA